MIYTVAFFLQLTLYSVMLGDRYVTPPPGGLLFYLKASHMQGLAALPHEKRGVANAWGCMYLCWYMYALYF